MKKRTKMVEQLETEIHGHSHRAVKYWDNDLPQQVIDDVHEMTKQLCEKHNGITIKVEVYGVSDSFIDMINQID